MIRAWLYALNPCGTFAGAQPERAVGAPNPADAIIHPERTADAPHPDHDF